MKKIFILVFATVLGIFLASVISGQPTLVIDALKDLFDVSILSPQDNQVLTYNSSTSKWNNEDTQSTGWTDDGSTVRLTTSSDNVGIGRSNPSAKLHIFGAGTGATFALRIADSTPTDRLVVLDNGNVGIGTTNPIGVFHIYKTTSSPETYFQNTNVGIGTTSPVGIFQVGETSNPYFMVSSSGNVGVGTTNPMALFQVGTSPSAGLFLTGGANVGIGTSAPLGILQVGVSPNPPLLVETGGQVGIGTTNASAALDIQQTNITSTTELPNLRVNGFTYTCDEPNCPSTMRFNQFKANTIGSSVPADNVATMYIEGATTGDVLTNNYSLWIDDGDLRLDGNLSIGIGITKPTASLDIRGGGTGTNFVLRIANSTPTDKLVILDNGSVGIGNTAPTGLLQVGTYPSAPLVVLANGNIGIGNTSPKGVLHIGTSPSTGLVVLANGNVGIGTTNPIYAVQFRGGKIVATNGGLFDADEFSSVNVNSDMILNTPTSNHIKIGSQTGAFRPDFDNTTDLGFISGGLGNKRWKNLYVAGTSALFDNVGIGTSSPLAKLYIRSSDTATGFALRIADSTPTDRLVVLDNGNVGIGTTNPTSPLMVSGSVEFSGDVLIGGGDFYDDNGTVRLSGDTDVEIVVDYDTDAGTNAIKFAKNTGLGGTITNANTMMTILESGEVGIGITIPAFALDVIGTIRQSGTETLGQLYVQNPDTGTGPRFTLQIDEACTVERVDLQTYDGGTNLIMNLRQLDSTGTTPLYALFSGQTATSTLLTIASASITGGTVPAGNLLVTDIVSESGTVPAYSLRIFGKKGY